MAKNYDEIMELIGKAAEITSDNSKATAVVLKKLQDQEKLLGGISCQVENIDNRMSNVETRLDYVETSEEITTLQVETLKGSAQKRVSEIIGNDPLDHNKYFRTFILRLYKDARRNAGLGSKIQCTKKGDFQRCINYIEAWIPSCGCAELRAKADANAKARLEAKALGYID